MPRPDNFGDLDQHLTYFKADVIIAAYGYNESFAGEEGLPAFKIRLDKFLTHLKSQAYTVIPRLGLFSSPHILRLMAISSAPKKNWR